MVSERQQHDVSMAAVEASALPTAVYSSLPSWRLETEHRSDKRHRHKVCTMIEIKLNTINVQPALSIVAL